jgi:hypothetical protein
MINTSTFIWQFKNNSNGVTLCLTKYKNTLEIHSDLNSIVSAEEHTDGPIKEKRSSGTNSCTNKI